MGRAGELGFDLAVVISLTSKARILRADYHNTERYWIAQWCIVSIYETTW